MMPHEISLGDVYVSPMLLVIILAVLASGLSVIIFNKLKFSRYVYAPSYVFIAIMLLYMILIDHYWIKF